MKVTSTAHPAPIGHEPDREPGRAVLRARHLSPVGRPCRGEIVEDNGRGFRCVDCGAVDGDYVRLSPEWPEQPRLELVVAS